MDQPSYPVVQFLLRRGNVLAVVIALMPIVAALGALVVKGASWPLAAALMLSPVIWMLLKSYVEVLAIIADTLLPK